MAFRLISLILSLSLFCQQAGIAYASGELNLANYLSSMRNAVVQPDVFQPARLRYISYDSRNNDFKLLLDKGDAKLNNATRELFNYFLIGLALPNDTFWVNLRPDAPENIIDPLLEKTDIGKIFLEADLQLKKDTSSLTSPQNPEGKAYWNKLYKKAGELFGTENITIPTITRPWIVPNEVIVRETEDSAYIYKATLKVMLEADYLADQKTEKQKNARTEELKNRRTEGYGFSDPRLKELNEYSSQIIRETIIPKLTREVNSSKRYAQLRQVYYSLVLARWFKQKYSSLGSIRAQGTSAPVNSYIGLIDSGNLANLNSREPCDKQAYFQAYQKSFKDGEYNLKETVASPSGQSIRNYISGGLFITSSPMDKVKTVENTYLKSLLVQDSNTMVSSSIKEEILNKNLKITPKGIMGLVNTILDEFLNSDKVFIDSLTPEQKIELKEVIDNFRGNLNKFTEENTNVDGFLKEMRKSIAALDASSKSIMSSNSWLFTEYRSLQSALLYLMELAGWREEPVNIMTRKVRKAYSESGSPIEAPHKSGKLFFWNHENQSMESLRYVHGYELRNEEGEAIIGYLKENKSSFPKAKMNQLDNVIKAIEQKDKKGKDLLSGLRFALSEDGSFQGCVEIHKFEVSFVGINQWVEIAMIIAGIQELVDSMREEYYPIVLKGIWMEDFYIAKELDVLNGESLAIDYEDNLIVPSRKNADTIIHRFYEGIKEQTVYMKGVLRPLKEGSTGSPLTAHILSYEEQEKIIKIKKELSILAIEVSPLLYAYPGLKKPYGKVLNKIKEFGRQNDILSLAGIMKEFYGAASKYTQKSGGNAISDKIKEWAEVQDIVNKAIEEINKSIDEDIESDDNKLTEVPPGYGGEKKDYYDDVKMLLKKKDFAGVASWMIQWWLWQNNDIKVRKWWGISEELKIINMRSGLPHYFANAALKSGGIDLTDRFMHLKIERVGSFADLRLVLPEVKNAQDIDLDNEFKQIEAIASSGIVPNSRRILELFSACYSRGEFGQRLSQVISCLKASSAIQESLAIDSDDDFRLCLLLPEIFSDGG